MRFCWLLSVLVLLLAACASAPEPGDPAQGAALFQSQACSGCHAVASLEGAESRIGPALDTIGLQAETRVAGQSAETYLETSIVFPNAFLSPGYPPNIMPLDYGATLSVKARRDLVAYLLTLR